MIEGLPIITDRLIINEFSEADAPFLVQLMNSPSYIEYIGDRGIRTDDQAADYISSKIMPSYTNDGYGFYLARLRHMDFPIGLVGVVKRDILDVPDLGYALLEEYSGMGYAYEACMGVIDHCTNDLLMPVLQAVTTDDNVASTRLLSKLGFRRSHITDWYEGESIQVYTLGLT